MRISFVEVEYWSDPPYSRWYVQEEDAREEAARQVAIAVRGPGRSSDDGIMAVTVWCVDVPQRWTRTQLVEFAKALVAFALRNCQVMRNWKWTRTENNLTNT